MRGATLPPATIVWTGASNSLWSTAANWSPARVPTAADHVAITSNIPTTVTLDITATISTLRLGFPGNTSTQTIAMPQGRSFTATSLGLVTASGALSFSSGVLLGNWETEGRITWSSGQIDGRVTIAASGRMEIAGASAKALNSGDGTNPTILTNRGVVVWQGGGPLSGCNNSQVRNYGEWRLEGDGTAMNYCGLGTVLSFWNHGLLVKTAGAGTNLFSDANFVQYGTVRVPSGALHFPGTATTWNDGSRVEGTGRVRLPNDSATFNGLITLDGILELSGATIFGSGRFAGTQPLLWTAGGIDGRLTIEPTGLLYLAGASAKTLNSGDGTNPTILTNRGVVVWQGGGPLSGCNNSQVRNYGEWRLEGDGTAMNYCGLGTVLSFWNHGQLRRGLTTGDATIVTTSFLGDGAIVLESGRLVLTPNSAIATLGASNSFHFPLRGSMPRVDFGQFSINEPLTLGGKLSASLENGFTPTNDQRFELISAVPAGGSFADETLPSLPLDMAWFVDYSAAGVALVVTDPCFANGLIGWWPAEGDSIDAVGSHHGTLNNGARFTNGFLGQALWFDGVDDFVNLGPWSPGTQWTLEAWVNPASLPSGRNAILGGMQSCFDWAIVLQDGRFGVAYRPPSGCTATLRHTTNAVTGRWYHVAASYDGNSVKLYVDGALSGTASAAPYYIGTTAGTRIGGNVCCAGENFHGAVDEPGIFNRALSSADINALFTAGARGRCASFSLRVARFTPTGTLTNDVARLELRFNQPIRTNTFTAADVSLSTPTGSVSTAGLQVNEIAPFNSRTFEVLTPLLSADGNYQVTIGPEIEDLLGHLMGGESPQPFVAPFTIDKTGPRILRMTPSGAVSNGITFVEVQFNSAIASTTFSTADVSVTGPLAPTVTSIQARGSNVWRINFSGPLGEANYNVTVGPQITDLPGNAMNQDGDALNGEPTEDRFVGTLEVVLPDLAVVQIAAPQTIGAGQPIGITWVTTNQGSGLVSGLWQSRVSFSRSATGEPKENLGTFSTNASLAIGSSLTQTGTVILPAGLTGQLWFVIEIDSANAVPEAIETNNTFVARQAIHVVSPDLIVVSVSAPGNAQFGDLFGVSWTTTNRGTATASGNWQDRVYLSTNAGSVAGATLLATVPAGTNSPLGAGSGYMGATQVTVPLNSVPVSGDYFIVVQTDASGVAPESDEGNNLDSTLITLIRPPLPDLAIADVSAPQSGIAGGALEVIYSLTNRGMAMATGVWSQTISFTNNAGGVVALGSFSSTNALAVAASIVQTQVVTIPSSFFAGSWTVLVMADSRNEVTEEIETNNLGVATNATTLPALLQLTVSGTEISEAATNQIIRTVITRNTDRSQPLAVTLTNTDPSELNLPTSVTIPAGQSSIAFDIRVVPDGTNDGTQLVRIDAGAAEFPVTSVFISVLDADLPRLVLTLDSTMAIEGSIRRGVVSRETVSTQETFVAFNSSLQTVLRAPMNVVIPSNGLSAAFELLAVDDSVIRPAVSVIVTATAVGHTAAEASVMVLDADVPRITVNLAASSVSEGAGPSATTVTVTRDPVTAESVVLELESSDPTAARVPNRVTIAAGRASAIAQVLAVDDGVVDGPQTTSIRAWVLGTGTSIRVSEGTPGTLTVTDDDGPTLRLDIARDLVGEGLTNASTATLTRNTSTNENLVVTLLSGDTTEATVPPTVTIPAGQSSANFTVSSVADGTNDGNQFVIITASATGYTSGRGSLIVSDHDLPDLVVSEITTATNAETEASLSFSYRVENRGNVAANPGWMVRVLLSRDPLVGGDTQLAQFDFAGLLAPGADFRPAQQVRLPREEGDYWIIVVLDADDRLSEAREDNNTRIAAQPIHVSPAYRATVQADITTALAGTRVPLHGRALRIGSNQPVPNALVNIHVSVRDVKRILTAFTDANGDYAVTFEPLLNEAGAYSVGADHPGVSQTATQDTFSLLGMKFTPEGLELNVVEGHSITGRLDLVNLSDVALDGISVSVAGNPANLNVALNFSNNVTAGFSSNALTFVISAADASTPGGIVVIRAASSQGATAEANLAIEIRQLVPRLVATPHELVAGMTRGRQRVIEFVVVNAGGAPTGPLEIALPPVPWLRVVSTNPLPSLDVGESNKVALQLAPAADLPLATYPGSLVVNGSNSTLTVPFTFRALSDSRGDLQVLAEDEYTYYASGFPKLAGANVSVRNATTMLAVTNGITDTNGLFFLPQLVEDYYDIEVTADRHTSYRTRILLTAGMTNEARAFLSRQTVQYIWKVEPTVIEDRTRITIETVFETAVPLPVIRINPAGIDLDNPGGGQTLNNPGDTAQVDIEISNEGLLGANGFTFNFDSHPCWEVIPLVSDLGTLSGQSSVKVPVLIRRKECGDTNAPPCEDPDRGAMFYGRAEWNIVCGTNRYYSQVIPLWNARTNCATIGGGRIGGGGGGRTRGSRGFGLIGHASGGGPGSRGTPRYPFAVVPEVRPADPCSPCSSFQPVCLEGKASTDVFEELLEVVKPIIKKLPVVDDVTFKASGGIKLCTCCDTNGTGFRLEGSANADAEIAIEYFLIGGKLEQEFDLNAFSVKIKSAAGCPLRGKINAGAFITATTDCHFENPNICGGFKGGGEISLGCVIEGSAELTDADGTKLSETGVNIFAQIKTGVTVDVKRCLNSSNLSYRVCFTGLRLEVGAEAKFPGVLNFSTNYGIDLLEASCIASNGPAPGAAPPIILASLPSLSKTTPSPSPAAKAGGAICATVRLKLDQDLILARNAFNASLELINNDPDLPLEDVFADVAITGPNGESAGHLFTIVRPILTGLTTNNGTGILAAGKSGQVRWILIPTSEAAPIGETVYRVGGALAWKQGGQRFAIPLTPVPITVYPDPRLRVQYFHQRDVFSDDPFTSMVEPSVPYSLAVMIRNEGRGTANNVRIVSAQPQIIENEKGLVADFRIIATEVAGRSITPSLTANFGQIPGGNIAIGRWLLTSTIQGLFTEYTATMEHIDDLGTPHLSLVEEVSIHEMIHLVQAAGVLEDGKPDFLVNEIPDSRDLPDTIYLSNGTTNLVAVVEEASNDGAASPDHLTVQLQAAFSSGWSYLRVPDPGRGAFILTRVVRSDGLEIPVNTNAWTTDRTFVGQGRRPVRENILHLVDHASTGSYRLIYRLPAAPDIDAPLSVVNELPSRSYSQIPVAWSGSDGNGIAFYDLFVSTDGGAFIPYLERTTLRSVTFPGQQGHRYAFYTRATDTSGNREEAPGAPDAETTVSLTNTAPVIAAIAPVTVNEGNTAIVNPSATDADVPAQPLSWSLGTGAPVGATINPATGRISWPTAEANGPSTNQFALIVRDNGTPSLSATTTVIIAVNEVNAAPRLLAIPNRTVNEESMLGFTASASDSDLPGQALRFSLLNAPAGASINSTSGVFAWRPTPLQGPSTNLLKVVVSDSGTPSLSATQQFTVIVRDTRADFILTMGSTNLLTSQTSSVPVKLSSLLDFTNLNVGVEIPAAHLTNLTLAPLASSLASALLVPGGGDRNELRFGAVPGGSLMGELDLAQLGFTATGTNSAIAWLRVLSLEGARGNGDRLTNGVALNGRIIVVAREPVLVPLVQNGRALEVYGLPWVAYEVQSAPSLAGPWRTTSHFAVTNARPTTIPLQGGETMFYRGIEFTPVPPVLEFKGRVMEAASGEATESIVYGLPGGKYWLQSAPAVNGQWSDLLRLNFTNAFRIFTHTNEARQTMFLRIRQEP